MVYFLVTFLVVLIMSLVFLKKRIKKNRSTASLPIHKNTNKLIPVNNAPPISHNLIHDNAISVLTKLNKNGYQAFLVGGCIRDILLGITPKDFDIATNATPEQVRKIFKNSRIIGRRFKLIHVYFGREIIEVATFRANHSKKGAISDNNSSRASEAGQLLRDNVYGSIEDDALRRDFTINSLYYTIDGNQIYDFCQGLRDIENRVIRLIGTPEIRYREDPVRMLRAIRFSAKLDFTLTDNTANSIKTLAPLLFDIPAARLFDEVLKLFLTGRAQKTYILLENYSLLQPIFPLTEKKRNTCQIFNNMINKALQNTDTRIKESKHVTPAFFFAVMLWKSMQEEKTLIETSGVPPVPALHQASSDILSMQCNYTFIPKRFAQTIREIWELQIRLEKRQPSRITELIEHTRFRAAYDFLILRESAGEQLQGAGKWWTDYQEAQIETDKLELIKSLPRVKSPRSRRKKSHYKNK